MSKRREEIKEKLPPILDACCGSRMFHHDKHNPLVLYNDKHARHDILCDGRTLDVTPDTTHDFTDFPYNDESFDMVIFDPPHLVNAGKNGWQAKKYGVLPNNWQIFLLKGFNECWRVLAPGGTLIFKWNEHKIPVKQVLPLAPTTPVVWNSRPHLSKTHWMVFYKPKKGTTTKGKQNDYL